MTFTCHHGPNECFGNKVQSCAIEHIQVDSYQSADTRESKTLEYINCLMQPSNNFADAVYPVQRCGQKHEVRQWQNIEQCANSTEGSNLLQKNGVLTEALKPKLTSVPTVVFRNVSGGPDVSFAELATAITDDYVCLLVSVCLSSNTMTRRRPWR